MNQVLDSVLIALQAIWANKLRSFMTVLGNIVAVTSIVTVVTLIQGMNGMVADAIVSDIGADNFTVQRMPPIFNEDEADRNRNNPLITVEEGEAIRKFSPLIASVAAQAGRNATVSYRTEEINNANIQGVTASYADFSTFNAERGRMMSSVEVERGQQVTILGYGLADRLFGDIEPLEKTIKIAGIGFRVVGISEKKGSFFGDSQDNFAVIPLGAYQRLFGARQSLQLMVKPVSTDRMPEAMDDATVALRVARRLKPSAPNNFGIITSDFILDLYRQVTSGIFAVLVGIVALSLVVGGIVIMNIMLMVVSERTREIGLRKALGAKRRDIMSQVLTESITLSVVGGIIGIALGALFSTIISSLTPVPSAVELWSVGLGVAITAAVGLFFGWMPARRAAMLDPIEALRRE
jgi:putative ABC transport system permease protein